MNRILQKLLGAGLALWQLIKQLLHGGLALCQLAKRFYAHLYGWTITIFYAWQGVFIYRLTHGWVGTDVHGKNINADDALTASLTIAVHVVVFLNTLAFLIQLSPIIARISQSEYLSRAEKRLAKDCYDTFHSGLLAATIIAAILAVLITFGIFGVTDTTLLPWKGVLQINEISSLFIFAIFLFSDLMGYRACKIALASEGFRSSGSPVAIVAALEELKLAVAAVDVPGFLGLAFIVLISRLVYPQYIRFDYWHGFVAGAIALHVAFSQSALALLAARHHKEKGTDADGVVGGVVG
jgi:hypothetical protein